MMRADEACDPSIRSLHIVGLALANATVIAHVYTRGCREGWWPVLGCFLRDLAVGLVSQLPTFTLA